MVLSRVKGMVAAGLFFMACAGLILYPELGGPPIEVTGSPVKIEVAATPFDLQVTGEARLEKLGDNVIRLTAKGGDVSIALSPDEAIYGLTERIVDNHMDSEEIPKEVGGLNLRGEKITMWVYPTISAYSPFYISSAGYGMLVEGTRPGIYDIGKTNKDTLKLSWDIGDKEFSCVFFKGDTYTQILDLYTQHVGRPVFVPKWFFLPLKWRDEHTPLIFSNLDGLSINAEVAEDILMYEKLDLPIGTYMIDRPWAEGSRGFGNFTWDAARFPNGDAMIEKLHARGWRVIVWGAPWAIGRTPREFGPEAEKMGCKVSSRELDYTNPKCVAWHQEKIKTFLQRSKIDGWKLDRGEETNPSEKSYIYHDGRTGFEVHNDYPRLYIKTYYDATRAVRGDDFVLMPRAAYTGTQQWSVVWGGDTRGRVPSLIGDKSTDLGLRSTIISLQRMACMGFPVWGSDTGGYQGFKDREVFARWLEFSAFNPIMEIGGVGPHEPWAMPGNPKYDEEMIKIFRRYTWIHARLQDYTNNLSIRANQTGNPIVHPLVFDWPADAKVKDMWDEYMYGPSLLIAPIWKTGQREREVYLPEGQWKDLWDPSQEFTGPVTIKVSVPLDKVPVFVKADQAGLLPEGLIEGL